MNRCRVWKCSLVVPAWPAIWETLNLAPSKSVMEKKMCNFGGEILPLFQEEKKSGGFLPDLTRRHTLNILTENKEIMKTNRTGNLYC